MKSICVYCGSSTGRQDVYADAACDLAAALVARNLTLVYGGASIGLMGMVADGVLQLGGEAVGVIPEALLSKEIAHRNLTRLHVTRSMHERKTLMAELADGFIALPGGVGTLEEIFEVWTWAQLGLHGKPCGLLNVAGYFDALVNFIDHTVEEGFVKQRQRSLLLVDDDAKSLLERFAGYLPPVMAQVIGKLET